MNATVTPNFATLTTEDIQLIKHTWGVLITHPDQLSQVFYNHLFKLHPTLRPLFRESIEERGKKLIHTITVMITKLGKLNELEESVSALSHRHLKYKVHPGYFEAFQRAFMVALEELLIKKWTPELANAWETLLQLMSQAMIKGMDEKLKQSA